MDKVVKVHVLTALLGTTMPQLPLLLAMLALLERILLRLAQPNVNDAYQEQYPHRKHQLHAHHAQGTHIPRLLVPLRVLLAVLVL